MTTPVTLDAIKTLPFEEVLKICYGRLNEYAADPPETEAERMERIDRTLDEMPDLHSFFLEAKAWFGHWADGYAHMEGNRSANYRQAKSRRDAMDDLARAARARWEGASRLVTLMNEQGEASRLPRSR